MASVHYLKPSIEEFYSELQDYNDKAEAQKLMKTKAVVLIQRMVRGYCIRKWLSKLSYNATIIQCAFRCMMARKAYRTALKHAVQVKWNQYYTKAATIFQALLRGYHSRRTKFCFTSYRRWLRTIVERSNQRAAEAEEFRLRSRADDLNILEKEAREWLAYVVFKLHHLLRTYKLSGVFSDAGTSELSEFENLLKSIKYTTYMRRLKLKYEAFVRKHKSEFSKTRLFPVIGEGQDYWYLSLLEMYEMTMPVKNEQCSRHKLFHHGPLHKQPFRWCPVKYDNSVFGDPIRGPFTSQQPKKILHAPSLSRDVAISKDPRFNIYVKHYKPAPDVMEYIEFHINAVLKRKNSIQNISICKYPPTADIKALRNLPRERKSLKSGKENVFEK